MVSSKGRTWLGSRSGIPGISLLLVVSLVGLGGAASGFGANTYYVSKSTGNDANSSTQAKSKSTPWAHLPGMASCASGCASYSPVAGDNFILMGCDVWVNADLPVMWQWSGTSGSPIYIGVDKTWYNTTNCPSGWNRPIWNAQKTVIASGNEIFWPSPSGNNSYVTLDNIEMTQLEITSGTAGSAIGLVGSSSQGWTFSNNYIHAWDASADNCTLIQGTYEATSAANIVYENNVISGADATGSAISGSTGVCYAFYTNYSGVKIINNVIQYVVNAVIVYNTEGTLEIGGNLIQYGLNSYQGVNHCNLMEIVGGGAFYVHDNIMRDLECSGGEAFMDGNSGETMYAWNNVIYNLGSGQTPSSPQTAGQTGISLHYYNNTVVSPGGQSCWNNSGQGGYSYTAFVLENNHCIGTGSLADTWTGGFPTSTTNVLMTPTTATSQGYTASETYAYSPTSNTNGTVGAGTNLTSSWPGGFSTNDTGYGASLETVSGVVEAVSPGRTSNTRPPSGAWDVGTYLYLAGDPPNPPTGLTAVVQ